MSDFFSIDVSNVKFCTGPCNSFEPEPEPLNDTYYYFKPHSGNRYTYTYPYKKSTLYINNLRICRGCNNRYIELCDENDLEQLEKDAETILKKLDIKLV
tara:strand:+ start:775 stop:1071 length:297 start_codon:yes stop_codon:yes gene_type:complete